MCAFGGFWVVSCETPKPPLLGSRSASPGPIPGITSATLSQILAICLQTQPGHRMPGNLLCPDGSTLTLLYPSVEGRYDPPPPALLVSSWVYYPWEEAMTSATFSS